MTQQPTALSREQAMALLRRDWSVVAGRGGTRRRIDSHILNVTETHTQLGQDLVEASGRLGDDACPFCAPWNGILLSITGRTPGVPRLDDARARGLFHEGCCCALLPYVSENAENWVFPAKLVSLPAMSDADRAALREALGPERSPRKGSPYADRRLERQPSVDAILTRTQQCLDAFCADPRSMHKYGQMLAEQTDSANGADYREALIILRAVLSSVRSTDTVKANALHTAGDIYERCRMLPEALRCLQRALELNPKKRLKTRIRALARLVETEPLAP